MRRPAVAVLLLLSVVAAAPALGPASADWPQWRGPARDGHATLEPPQSWPAQLQAGWQQAVGLGHSSPIVVGDTVFQFSRRGEREVLAAFRLQDGEPVWESATEAPYRMHSAARGHGPGPKSTPAHADGRLFTLGISGILSAHGAGTGELLWRHDFADRFESTAPIYGAAMSPLVLDDRVIVHVGGHHDGALAAFHVATGETLWSLDGDGPGYASPLLVTFDGVAQVVTQTDSRVVALAPDDGRLLWSLPFTTDYDQNVVTPLPVGPQLVISGLDQGVFSLRPEIDADAWKATEAWRSERVSMYMNSPVLLRDRLFGMSHLRAGQFFALRADSGEVVWTSQGREGENAAIVALGSHVLFLTEAATLTVVDAAADEYAPLAVYTVADSPTWAHPVPVAGGILVKDLDGLRLWRIP